MSLIETSSEMAPGLADAVFDSQRVFRVVLDTMARPGRPVALDLDLDLDSPAPLDPMTAAVCLALVDFETPLWLDVPGAATDYLHFHCGCPMAARPAEAAFAVITDAAAMPELGAFSQGSDEAPETSATLLIQAQGLVEGEGLRLTGPGIEREARLRIDGLPPGFWDRWAENHALFPGGVDALIVADGRVVGLPRTTRMED